MGENSCHNFQTFSIIYNILQHTDTIFPIFNRFSTQNLVESEELLELRPYNTHTCVLSLQQLWQPMLLLSLPLGSLNKKQLWFMDSK